MRPRHVACGMLRLLSLSKRFNGVTAVDSLSLDIKSGEMVGVIGHSGAGKSTLLRMINRLTEATYGQILFGDVDVTALEGRALLEWRSQCAMVFQQFNLVGRMNVLQNVLAGRIYHHNFMGAMLQMFTPAERALAIRALDRLGMAHTALQRAEDLSGGQQQRVAIARALVQEPAILLADEPIASLDPLNARIVMDALRRMNQEDGVTVLVNLHTPDTARHYCDRIVGLRDGRLCFDGSPDQLTDAMAREIYGTAAGDALSAAPFQSWSEP